MRAHDPDEDTILFNITCPPGIGTVEIINPNTGEFEYSPVNNMYGADSFAFQVNDGEMTTRNGVIFVDVEPVNDPPMAFDLEIDVWEGETAVAHLLAIDPVRMSNSTSAM